MNASRSAGYSAGSGAYAHPALRMPSTATTKSIERSKRMPTKLPGSTPLASSRLASRPASAASSAYVRRCPSQETATAAGARAACVANSWSSVASRTPGPATAPRATAAACSRGLAIGIRQIGASGVAVAAASRATTPSSIRVAVAASNRSVAYSRRSSIP